MRFRTGFALLVLVTALACSSQSRVAPESNALPTAPSAVATPAGGATAAVVGREDVMVNILDACDPTTFNARFGAGTCVRNGGVTVDQFIAMLTRLQVAGPWHFSPPSSHVQVGQTFNAVNHGGETHTFTHVANFGGGFVAPLNQLSGAGDPVPECLALEPDDFVAAGATYREAVEHTGTLRFQCCIHPWMRLEATAVSR